MTVIGLPREILRASPAEKKSAIEGLSTARFYCTERVPYFADGIYAMKPVCTEGVPTMASDRYGRLYYDPAVISTWEIGDVAFGYLHEEEHFRRDHAGRQGDRDPMGWNIAGDLEINQAIAKMGFKCKGFEPLFPAKFGFPEGLSAEQYYDMLPKSGGGGGDRGGNPKSGVGQGRCGSCAGNPEEWEKGPGDKSAPPPLSQTDKELLRRKTAQNLHDRQKTRGDVPGDLMAWADLVLTPPKVPWQRVLAKLIRGELARNSDATERNPKKISRRWMAVSQCVKDLPIVNGLSGVEIEVGIVLDTSGSMSVKICEALSEVYGIVQAAGSEIKVWATDAAVQTVKNITGKRGLEDLMVGGGGTDMRVGIVAAFKECKTVIVITDGYTPWPSQGEIPRGYKVIATVTTDEQVPDHIHDVVRVN